MDFWLINVVLLFLILILLLVLSFVWPPDSPWAPWWRTSSKKSIAACRLGKVSKKDKFFELGCGDGGTLIIASKEFGARATGIEIDPLRYFISKIKVYLSGAENIKVIRKNFFDIDLSEASVVYVYLVPKALKRLLPKFKKELKKGTRIISYKYKIDLPLVKEDLKNEMRLYTII